MTCGPKYSWARCDLDGGYQILGGPGRTACFDSCVWVWRGVVWVDVGSGFGFPLGLASCKFRGIEVYVSGNLTPPLGGGWGDGGGSGGLGAQAWAKAGVARAPDPGHRPGLRAPNLREPREASGKPSGNVGEASGRPPGSLREASGRPLGGPRVCNFWERER